MYAPPGFDSDSSSGEEITPPSSAAKTYAKFSLKSVFKPGRVRPPLLGPRKGATAQDDATKNQKASVAADKPLGKIKKKVRIFVEGDEPLEEIREDSQPASSASLQDDSISGPHSLPPSSSPKRQSKRESKNGVGKEVLQLLEQLIAENAAQKQAQSTLSKTDTGVSEVVAGRDQRSTPPEQQSVPPAVSHDGPSNAEPGGRQQHLNESYYQGYPPPAPYQGAQQTRTNLSNLQANYHRQWAHDSPHTQAVQSHISGIVPPNHTWHSPAYPLHPPYNADSHAPAYTASYPPQPLYPTAPPSAPYSAPPQLWSTYPLSPPPVYHTLVLAYPPPTAPPQIGYSPWPPPDQPWPSTQQRASTANREARAESHEVPTLQPAPKARAPKEGASGFSTEQKTRTGKNEPNDTVEPGKVKDTPESKQNTQSQGLLDAVPKRINKGIGGSEAEGSRSGRKHAGGLTPEEVAKAVRRASIARGDAAGTGKVSSDHGSDEKKQRAKEGTGRSQVDALHKAEKEEYRKLKMEKAQQGETGEEAKELDKRLNKAAPLGKGSEDRKEATKEPVDGAGTSATGEDARRRAKMEEYKRLKLEKLKRATANTAGNEESDAQLRGKIPEAESAPLNAEEARPKKKEEKGKTSVDKLSATTLKRTPGEASSLAEVPAKPSTNLPPPSPRSPDEVFKDEARRRYDAAKKAKLAIGGGNDALPSTVLRGKDAGKDQPNDMAPARSKAEDKEMEIKKREALKRRMAERAYLERAARSGERPPGALGELQQVRKGVKDEASTDNNRAKPAQEPGPKPSSSSRDPSSSKAKESDRKTPAATALSAQDSPRINELSWSKALVSLASCIDLMNTLLSQLAHASQGKTDSQEDSVLSELLSRMLHALLSQQDMMSSMRDVLGQEHAPALADFVRNVKIISGFLIQHMSGAEKDPKQLAVLEKQTAEAFESGSVLVVLQHLMQFSERLSPTILDTLKSLFDAWRKDGLTIKNVIHTIVLVKKELDFMEDTKDRKKKRKGKNRDGEGFDGLLEKVIGLLLNADEAGCEDEPKSKRRLTPLKSLSPATPSPDLLDHKKARREQRRDLEDKHREKLKVMMKSLGEKLHPHGDDIIEPESPPHVTAPLKVKRKTKPPSPYSSSGEEHRRSLHNTIRRSMSSSSCYSDNSADTIKSDDESRRLLAQADSGPTFGPACQETRILPREKIQPSKEEIGRAEKLLINDSRPRRVERGGRV